MDERSPKRRRTSAAADVTSPSHEQHTSPRSRRRRPSYASPTRASMMRHNPQIIERREAVAAAEGAEAQTAAQTTSAREQTAAPRRGGILAPPGQQQQHQPPPDQPTTTTIAPPTETTRPEEPEAPNTEFVPRTARPAQVTGLAPAPPPEPELPPARPDPVTSSPSRGIHNTPSRWRTRAKQKSSPLKQPSMRPDQGDEPSPVPTPHVLQRRPNPPAVGVAGEEERPRDTTRPDPTRNVSLLDPAKVKERNALREELAQLQRDLELATQENARLLSTQNTGRYAAPGNKDKILDLLRRSLISADSPAPEPQSQQLMMAALNPIGLLPFSKPVATLVPDTEDGKDIASHHPIEMSAEEELAYLKVFSPFDVTSSVAALPATREHPFRQRRILTLRDKERLFQARVELIINPVTLAILELRVLSLEPAAAAELRSFVDTVCGGGGGGGPCNRSMQRNVGMLFWAMAEWRRAAVERAEVWARLDAEVLAKGGPAQAAAAMRKQAEQTSEKVALPPRKAVVLGGSDLRYLMGKQAYDIPIESGGSKRDDAHIRLEWKICFDWTGEAESKLAVLEGVPGKWRRADRRGSLGKLGGLFQDLVRGSEDVDVAARKIAALLVDAGV